MSAFPRVPALCLSLVLCSTPALAAPGAHGPNGEHLEGPGAAAAAATGAVPRMEARTDEFELVARLSGGELTLMINRFATGEPVLDAQVEVEAGAQRLRLPFHTDGGDYATDDEALLKALARPGSHPLVVTVRAGDTADLLDGTLEVTPQGASAFAAGGHGHDHAGGHDDHDDHGHGHGLRDRLRHPLTWLIGLGALALAAWALRRRRRATNPFSGDAR
jgi:hypothetical protein